MVLFDMDGLLLDTEKLGLDCFNNTTFEFALPDLSDVYLGMVGHRGADSNAILKDGLEGRIDFNVFVSRWMNLIAVAMAHGVPVKPGVRKLLNELQNQSVRMVVATSTRTVVARDNLKKAGLLSYFETVIGGDQVLNGKPDPEVYHKAAASLGLTASDCIVFEDSDPGTRAGIASGATVVQVPDLKQPSAEVRALGHLVAENILEGARAVGLIR